MFGSRSTIISKISCNYCIIFEIDIIVNALQPKYNTKQCGSRTRGLRYDEALLSVCIFRDRQKPLNRPR